MSLPFRPRKKRAHGRLFWRQAAKQDKDKDNGIWLPPNLELEEEEEEEDCGNDGDTLVHFKVLLQKEAVQLLSQLLRQCILSSSSSSLSSLSSLDNDDKQEDNKEKEKESVTQSNNNNNNNTKREEFQTWLSSCVTGRFRNLASTQRGQDVLEGVFVDNVDYIMQQEVRPAVLRSAIWALQCLAVYGTLVGASADADADDDATATNNNNDKLSCTSSVVKDNLSRATMAALQVLAACRRRQSAWGAMELLQRLGAWERCEFLPLLKSHWQVNFTPAQEKAAQQVLAQSQAANNNNNNNVDALLGLEQDLTHLKVYTIDPTNPLEVDDGLSVERLPSGQFRFWIHIANAHAWLENHDANGRLVWEMARQRGTSLYLPHLNIPMFPSCLGSKVMSLRPGAKNGCKALSLGVELHSDGSLVESSLVVTPSVVRVTFALSYQEVNEMFQEGVAYREEEELGHLLNAAQQRQEWRISQGSMESWVPRAIPKASLHVDKEDDETVHLWTPEEESSSLSFLLVSEMMILAGEAMGRWALLRNKHHATCRQQTGLVLKLPFRTQPPLDFSSRPNEALQWQGLQQDEEVHAYCCAWFARRFFKPARIRTTSGVVQQEDEDEDVNLQHSLLGLPAYVQWTSPIRRFSDLQVHASVKRFLRCERVQSMWQQEGIHPPPQVTSLDLGVDIGTLLSNIKDKDSGQRLPPPPPLPVVSDYSQGLSLVSTASLLQRQAHEYWMLHYISRLPADASWECLVLGCIDVRRWHYAVYIVEWKMEYKYKSEKGELRIGQRLYLCVADVNPTLGILSFTLSSKSGGIAGQGKRTSTSSSSSSSSSLRALPPT